MSIGIVYDMFFFFSQFLLSPFARDKTVNALTVNYLIISRKQKKSSEICVNFYIFIL
jgi:hypothetical protein